MRLESRTLWKLKFPLCARRYKVPIYIYLYSSHARALGNVHTYTRRVERNENTGKNQSLLVPTRLFPPTHQPQPLLFIQRFVRHRNSSSSWRMVHVIFFPTLSWACDAYDTRATGMSIYTYVCRVHASLEASFFPVCAPASFIFLSSFIFTLCVRPSV